MQHLLLAIFLTNMLFLSIAHAQPICPSYPEAVPLSADDLQLLQPTLKQVDLMIEQWVTNNSIGGFIATVVIDQDIVWSKGYGSSNAFVPGSPPPTIDNFVSIASITKVFTDLMLYQLRDAGQVSMDDYVDKYMTNFSVKSTFPSSRHTTLRQLASHTSGLQREVPCFSTDNQTVNRNAFSCTEEQILANLAETYLIYSPYSMPHYSNLGISLLGRTLEKVVGITYEEYVMQHLCAPLGLNATFALSPEQQSLLAVGTFQFPNGSEAPAPVVDNGWPAPAGGLLATARDIAKLLSFFFRSAPSGDASQIVDPTTVQEMQNPTIVFRDGQGGFGTPIEFSYDDTSPYWTLSKAGQLPGYRSQVALMPPLKLGLFVAALNTTVPDDLTDSVLTQPLIAIIAPVLANIYWANQPMPQLPTNLDAYVGSYVSVQVSGNQKVKIYSHHNTLLATSEAIMVNLTEFLPDIFRAEIVDPQLECRWLVDGVNDELMYFNVTGSHASSLVFMGGILFYDSSETSDRYRNVSLEQIQHELMYNLE